MINWKRYFFIFGVFFTVQFLAISLLFNAKNEEMKQSIAQRQDHFITTYNTIFSTYTNLPKVIFEGRINNNYIANLLKAAYATNDVEYKQLIKDEIYDQLKKAYDNILLTSGFKELHFVLKNSQTLLRFSHPNVFGNNDSSTRFSLREIQNIHIPLEGFENGMFYNGYHYVYPIFLQNEYVGAVDFVLEIETYLNAAAKALGGEQRFIMKWENIQKESLKTEGKQYIRSCLSSDFIYQKRDEHDIFTMLNSMNKAKKDEVHEKLMGTEPFSVSVSLKGETHLATFIPVFTIEKKVGGFIIGAEHAQFLDQINRNFIKNIAFLLFSSSLVLFLLFGYFKERYLLKKIVENNASLEEKVEQRTLELKRNVTLLDTILKTLPTPVFYKDLSGIYITCNKAFGKLVGIDESKIIGKSAKEIFPENIHKRFIQNDKKVLEKKQTIIAETRFEFENSAKDAVVYKSLLLDEEKPVGIIGVLHDITKQKSSQEKLKKAFEKIKKQQEILESDYEIIHKYTIYTKMDTNFKIIDVSEGLCHVMHLSKEEVLGKRHFELLQHDEHDPMYQKIRSSLLEGNAYEAEFEIHTKDGNKLWTRTIISPEYDEGKNLIGYVTFSQDISREKMIEEHSYKDELTKLYNRRKFNEELECGINMFERYSDDISLILFDIDKFKSINDTFGHLVGDKILKELALIVSSNIRECDTIARWGGEEFTIILPKTNLENAIIAAKKLRHKIINHDFGIEQTVTCSFGITLFKENDTPDKVIKRVDDMLYRAKNEGRDRIIYE